MRPTTRTCVQFIVTTAAALLLLTATASAAFTPGNLLASVGGGLVKEFTPTGELIATYDTGTGSTTTGLIFDSKGNLFVTDFDGNAVSEFDPTGTLVGSFGSGYNSDPESIVVDSNGNFYVGQADGSRQVLKFSPTGAPMASYSPETEDRGTDWLQLASDDCTLYYTSEGFSVKRFNVCTGTQLSDFVDNLPAEAYQLRFLPDGGMLVADTSAILRLDKEGNVVNEYKTLGGTLWFNVQFTPGASTFWAGDLGSGSVAEFDLNSGALLTEFYSAPVTFLAGLTVIGSPDFALKDSDGDGIPDEWEEHGVRDAEGHVLVNLPAMGADPRHKDVFVQLDAMHGLSLSHTSLGMVENAFNDAPVSNPDGTTGIHLHVDEGPSSVMNPVTGQTWGRESLANDDIPFKRSLGAYVGQQYNWAEFDTLKHESLIPAREAAFHYALSVNRYGGTASSGISRLVPSSDLIVALGPSCNPEGACAGSTKEQAGTFMHELGHNLGLRHGGQVDENFVPNYLSVMNYTFQFSGISTSPDGVDYSRYDESEIPTINENSLDEPAGFGAKPPLVAAFQTTKIWCSGAFLWEIVKMSGPVDFNCDGVATGTGLMADLHDEHGFGPQGAPQPTQFEKPGLLKSYDDWQDLWYRGGALGGNGLGALLPEETGGDEPSIAALDENARQLVPPPSGSTGNATGITDAAATVHGEVAPNGEGTQVYFQYGPNMEYGAKTEPVDVGSTGPAIPTSATLARLTASTKYHYQEVIETPTHLLYGADATFTTNASASSPPTSTSPPPSVLAHEPAQNVVSISTSASPHCVVPRLHGKTRRKAAERLYAAHCKLGRAAIARSARHHRGLIVIKQSRQPGATLPAGTPVGVTFGLPRKKPSRKRR
jgi:hypothetical protein